MSLSNPVIRRYTPPTCTLEIWAENSPLSRWTDQTIIRDLNFRLQFDDPRLSEERKIIIQGDQHQLEVLSKIVTTYVQELLQQSAEDFSINLLDTDNTITSPESELNDSPLSVLPHETLSSFNQPSEPSKKVYLEPSNNLTHKLFLGYLANQTSGSVIELTLLQLFDLATALDEYSSDIIVLPTTNNQAIPTRLPQWTPIAAVLVIAAGLTPFTWQYAQNFNQNNLKVAKNTDPTSTQVGILPASKLNLNTPQPELTPALPNFSPPPASLSFPNATISIPPKTPPLTNSIPSAPSAYPITPQIPLPPIAPDIANGSMAEKIRNSSNLLAKSGINTTIPKNLPSTSDNAPSNISKDSQSIATIPKNSVSNNSNPISASSDTESQQSTVGIAASEPLSQKEKNDNLIRRLRATKTSSMTLSNDKTLFDTPQVAEAREYLNKRWQPPTGLSQSLEYSLILGVDGTIERILPLNQAARQYIDSSGIPEIGKPFVSTNKSGQNLRIRVVMGADSKVQTFPETP